jgi:hypothetical protein
MEKKQQTATAGYNVIDKIRNEDISKELHVTDVIIKQKVTKENMGICGKDGVSTNYKTISRYSLAGKRDLGRPQKRWRDQFLI